MWDGLGNLRLSRGKVTGVDPVGMWYTYPITITGGFRREEEQVGGPVQCFGLRLGGKHWPHVGGGIGSGPLWRDCTARPSTRMFRARVSGLVEHYEFDTRGVSESSIALG